MLAALITSAVTAQPSDSAANAADKLFRDLPAAVEGEPPRLPCPPVNGSREPVRVFHYQPPQCLSSERYVATLQTDVGEIRVQLDAALAPQAANIFVFLARYRFYDGLGFHQVTVDRLAITGDPLEGGEGGPRFRATDPRNPRARVLTGDIVAVRNTDHGYSGELMFLRGEDAASLASRHGVIGRVIDGDKVIAAILHDEAKAGVPARHRVLAIKVE